MVRRFRRRAGLTQQEAAELAGLSVGGLRDIEQGRVAHPRARTVRQLGTVLALSRAELAELIREAGDEQGSGDGIRVEILGPLRVSVDGEPMDPGSEMQRVLLGLLALSPNTPVLRDSLVETVLGGRAGERGVDSLQSRISRLRRRLQPGRPESENSGALVAVRGGYQLTVAEGQHDLLTFRRLVARARQAREEGDLAEACRMFSEALALWRGDPLAGLAALQSHPAVVALVRDYRSVVVAYAEVACGLGRYQEVLPLLQQVADAEPLHEAAHAQLMIALTGSGQQAAALKIFDTLRRLLADELGADPGPELATAYQRVLRQEVSRPEYVPVAAYRQLPPDIADFTGREPQLRELIHGLPTSGRPTAVSIVVLEGMGGAGKTRLAVHLAHRLLADGRYGDAQLYVDLQGHSEQPPADPSAVLASFLRLLGVPGEKIPAGLEERSSLFRDRLYGKQALVLLDNAASEDQVLPLLPAGPSNLVVITSRRALAIDGADTFGVRAFTPTEARNLLVRVVGADRVAAEPVAVNRIVELCGRLPLAVALVARRLRSRSAWTIGELVDRLEQAGDRLSELAAGSRHLRAVFDLSYQALATGERRLFRLLGLHPGNDFTAESAAALAGIAPAEARRVLDRLIDENLVMVNARQRYRLHDLLVEYARGRVREEEAEEDREVALVRVLDFYLYGSAAAVRVLQPRRQETGPVGGDDSGDLPLPSDEQGARAWFDAERACLFAAERVAAEQGWTTHAWRLSHVLSEFLYFYGNSKDQDRARTHEMTLAAAVAADDAVGAAFSRQHLAEAYAEQGRVGEACELLRSALEFQHEHGDRWSEVRALESLGFLSYRAGGFAEALRLGERAVALCTGEDPSYEATLRGEIGFVYAVLGRRDEALDSFQRGLLLSRRHGNADGEARALTGIGDSLRQMGRYAEAVDCLERALGIGLRHGHLPRTARPLLALGVLFRELGRFDDAVANLGEALRIVRTVGGTVGESEVLIELGATHRDIGNLATAQTLLDEGLRLAVDRSERYQEARALYELAESHRCAARAELAEGHWRRAYALFQELGTPEADQVRPLLTAA
ncbi:BTAD domain-containing putative transcriptional regulator [Amycolatopsis rhizosphaerae]|nr:BTAD domain-containing putative transcriptional regulator [Amycolatopsis rhizosphaerae]